MKSLTIKRCLAIVLLVMVCVVRTTAQITVKTDPPTTAAVIAQTNKVGGELEKSAKAQQSTAATNATMTIILDSIRSYDKVMLKYLQEANSTFTQIYHAADAIDLASKIIFNLRKCGQAAVNHPKGVLITTLVNTRYSKIIAESTSLVNHISNFVKAGGNKNLLNSAERLKILHTVHSKLRKLNSQVAQLYWEIKTLEWTDLARMTNPELYYATRTDARLFKQAKRRIDKMFKEWE